ncbi:MAG: hypothetical protein HWE35_20680 [Rhodobacteraceae bacterium]|nr:hypothetical protein [Paracoccaceae bacterium]
MTSSEQQKQASGAIPAIIWFVGSISLFLFDDRSPNLFSFQALGFVVVGMFTASIIVGGFNYWLQTRIARVLSRKLNEEFPTEKQAVKFLRIGWLLLASDVVLSILFLYWVYSSFFLI